MALIGVSAAARSSRRESCSSLVLRRAASGTAVGVLDVHADPVEALTVDLVVEQVLQVAQVGGHAGEGGQVPADHRHVPRVGPAYELVEQAPVDEPVGRTLVVPVGLDVEGVDTGVGHGVDVVGGDRRVPVGVGGPVVIGVDPGAQALVRAEVPHGCGLGREPVEVDVGGEQAAPGQEAHYGDGRHDGHRPRGRHRGGHPSTVPAAVRCRTVAPSGGSRHPPVVLRGSPATRTVTAGWRFPGGARDE